MTTSNGLNSARKIYDVVIVGAGPVGLATAIGLRKRGITNFLVIEQAREFRKVGQVIDVLPNGLRALKFIDFEAYTKVKEIAVNVIQSQNNNQSLNTSDEENVKPSPPNRWRQINLKGETTRSTPTDYQSWFDRYGEGRAAVPWFGLQTALRNLLPPDMVQVNHRCVHVEGEAGCVRIDTLSDIGMSVNPYAFWEMVTSNGNTVALTQEHQESDRKSFYAKIVIAADGINSIIRPVLYDKIGLSEWAKPHYSGFSGIGSEIDNVPSSIIKELVTKYLQEDQFVTIHSNSNTNDLPVLTTLRLILIRRSENALRYLFFAPLSKSSWQDKSQDEILDLGIKTLKSSDFPAVFIKLLNLTNAKKLTHRPLFIFPATHNDVQPPWSHGRVALAGDAAHAMPPFVAQGVNQGFEDAAVLAAFISQLIQEDGLDNENKIADVLGKYEQFRRPIVKEVQVAAIENNQWTQQQWDNFNKFIYSRKYPSSNTLGEQESLKT